MGSTPHGLLAAATGLLVALAPACSGPGIRSKSLERSTSPAGSICRVDFVTDEVYSRLRSIGSVLSATDLETPDAVEAVDRVSMALRLYPSGSCACVGRQITVVLASAVDDGEELLSGVALAERDTIVLSRIGSIAGSIALQHTFHHEVFHLLRGSDRGWSAFDSQWRSVNAADFRYVAETGSTEAGVAEAETSDRPGSGFVTWYATHSPEEDQAELFSLLLHQPRLVQRMAVRDEVVRAKRRLMRGRLQEICPLLAATIPP